MVRTPLSAAIPDLELSETEQHEIIEQAAAVLAETLQIEREFLSEKVSKHEWKEVRGRHKNFQVYKERRRSSSRGRASDASKTSTETKSIDLEEVDWDGTRMNDESLYSDSFANSFVSEGVPLRMMSQLRDNLESTQSSSSQSSGGTSVTPASDYSVPMVVGIGQTDGHLEDVVFGAYAGDYSSWQQRAAYTGDKYTDSRILSTILGPTPEDPYRFLGIKWFAREQKRAIIGNFISDRDFLVIEATGITRDDDGATHGYYIMQSFRHPLIPELKERKVLRCDISLCYISRQISADKVQVFTRGFIDPKGSMPASFTIAVSAKPMMVQLEAVEVSYNKKLMWLAEQTQRSNPLHHQEPMGTRLCDSCQKKFNFMSSNLSTCQVCRHCVCSKCIIQRKLVVGVSSSGVTEHVLPFCMGCVQMAKHMPPHQVALDTVVGRYVR
ncbi:hypothetical protein Poli38472_012554 [Pythium oligandrum]|uniref:FYVE-type domain-containing protein n=1 Tax=Pythium oligandrum TaxID=41045 RepID=A0A8K1FK42_PYTOL|nr:hypothetical protein Poli38472_012554 [Pythium oligandrum]|eukprot:TMW61363.1 hypothetical protein Poli38472_012554 [Pythium oligandrum]